MYDIELKLNVIRTGLLRQDRLPPRARHHLRVLPVQYPAPNLVAHHPHQEVKARPKTVKGAEECDKERKREKAGPFSPHVFSSQIGAAIVPNVPLLPTMKTGIRAHCRGLRLLHSVNTRHYVSSNLEPAIQSSCRCHSQII